MSLAAERLRFAYGEQSVLDEVSLRLSPFEILGVVGPNGAGKSTLIALLTGLLRPGGGDIYLRDKPLAKLSRREIARQLAVVPQSAELPPGYSVRAMVTMGRAPHLGFLAFEGEADHAAVEAAMRRTDTLRLAERRVDELSGGERQRVVLARALAQEPSFLLLDEPTSHLDLRYVSDLLSLVRREVEAGLGALVVLHDLNVAARVCDRLLVLDGGRAALSGSPAEVLADPGLAKVYGQRLDIFPDPQGQPVVLPSL